LKNLLRFKYFFHPIFSKPTWLYHAKFDAGPVKETHAEKISPSFACLRAYHCGEGEMGYNKVKCGCSVRMAEHKQCSSSKCESARIFIEVFTLGPVRTFL